MKRDITVSTDQLIDKLIKAVSFKFRDDKTAPGVTVSALKRGYYCSVVRYGGAFAKDKKVFCHARANDLTTALRLLASQFVRSVTIDKDPVQELDDLVR